jgi:hypothetical protein
MPSCHLHLISSAALTPHTVHSPLPQHSVQNHCIALSSSSTVKPAAIAADSAFAPPSFAEQRTPGVCSTAAPSRPLTWLQDPPGRHQHRDARQQRSGDRRRLRSCSSRQRAPASWRSRSRPDLAAASRRGCSPSCRAASATRRPPMAPPATSGWCWGTRSTGERGGMVSSGDAGSLTLLRKHLCTTHAPTSTQTHKRTPSILQERNLHAPPSKPSGGRRPVVSTGGFCWVDLIMVNRHTTAKVCPST